MSKLPKIVPGVIKKIPKRMLRIPPGYKKPRTKGFEEDVQQLGENIAEGFKEKLLYNIETNYYGFALAESTIKKKGHATPLIDSGEMVDSIYVEGTVVSVEDTQRQDSELTNKELAIVHEYGTKDKNIPARPVWRLTFEDYRSEAKEDIVELLTKGKIRK